MHELFQLCFFLCLQTNQTKLLSIDMSEDPPSNLSFLYPKTRQPCAILYLRPSPALVKPLSSGGHELPSTRAGQEEIGEPPPTCDVGGHRRGQLLHGLKELLVPSSRMLHSERTSRSGVSPVVGSLWKPPVREGALFLDGLVQDL